MSYDLEDDPPPTVAVDVRTLGEDGEPASEPWETYYGYVFGDLVAAFASNQRETGAGVVVVEQDDQRAVLLWESDLGDTATLLLTPREIDAREEMRRGDD